MAIGRSSWKGFIKLSLVSVPVRAFTAHETAAEIRLNQLHADCNARVKYKKVCPEHGELAAKDIVSGYEYAKDQYVVIDPEELAKIRTQSDKAIGIEGFVPAERIDEIYKSGRTYYLLPDGIAGNKPYALLRQGMLDAGVVGFVNVVMSNREQLAVLRPLGDLLVMEILYYAAEVRAPGDYEQELSPEKVSKEELALAKTLIDASRLAEFDLTTHKDRYVENLRKLIEMKIAGQEVVQAPQVEEPKILNLMEALKRSVAEAQAAAQGGDGGERKMAPSATEADGAKASRQRKSG